MPNKKPNNTQKHDTDAYTKALEQLFASKYINKRKLYTANLLRGIAFGFGSLLGATVGVLLLLWLLSLFGHLPIVGKLTETIRHSIQSYRR